jgi:hypothetical protein
MPIQSNVDLKVPARDRLKREITLLSHGFACPEAFPDGKITVFPWDSTIDEWIAAHSRQEVAGKRFTIDLFCKLCNLNGCPKEKFVLGDVSTVILVSRSIRHNNQIEYRPVCIHCKTINASEIVSVPEQLTKIGEKSTDYKGFDIITLPVCKDIVKLRPLIVNDEMLLDQRSPEQKKVVTDELAHVLAGIVEIGGGQPSNVEELLAWYHAVDPTDQVYLNSAVDNLSPHLSPNLEHTCDSCGKGFTFVLPFEDRDFFRRSR